MDYTKKACDALLVTPSKRTKGYTYDSVRSKWIPNKIDCAFGVVLPNGSTFNKSVLDPDSHLVQLLYYIRDIPMTRNEILQGLFQFDLPNGRRWDSYNGLWIYCNPRGWRTPWFSGIKKAGFVTVDKKGRWHLTGLGARVLRYHGLY